MLAAGDRDGLEPRVHAERCSTCRTWFRTVSVLRCSSSAICTRRAAALEQREHLGLARRQVGCAAEGRLLDEIGDCPNTPIT